MQLQHSQRISCISFCISYVTNLALWLQDFNKLTYLHGSCDAVIFSNNVDAI